MFQNERIRYDEQGRKIKDSLVYRDFVRSSLTHSLSIDDILHAKC